MQNLHFGAATADAAMMGHPGMSELRKGGAGERELCALAGAEAQRRADKQLARDRRDVLYAILMIALGTAGLLVLLAA